MTQPHFGELPAARHMRRKRFSDVQPAALPAPGSASAPSTDAIPLGTYATNQDPSTTAVTADAGSVVESESGKVPAERASAPETSQSADQHRRKKLVALIFVILVLVVIVTLTLALVFLG